MKSLVTLKQEVLEEFETRFSNAGGDYDGPVAALLPFLSSATSIMSQDKYTREQERQWARVPAWARPKLEASFKRMTRNGYRPLIVSISTQIAADDYCTVEIEKYGGSGTVNVWKDTLGRVTTRFVSDFR